MNPNLPTNQPQGQQQPQSPATAPSASQGAVQPPQTAPPSPPPPDDGSHKQLLYDNFKYSTEEFDKTLLYVMSGMLAISFAFIEKIIPLDTAILKSTLLCGWILLSLGIGIYLVAHFILPFFYQEAINLYDENITPEQSKNRRVTNLIVHILNGLMLALTIIGSVFIMYFIKTNFNEKEKGNQKAGFKENNIRQVQQKAQKDSIIQRDSTNQTRERNRKA